VLDITGWVKTNLSVQADGNFPDARSAEAICVAWVEDEVLAMASRGARRRGNQAATQRHRGLLNL